MKNTFFLLLFFSAMNCFSKLKVSDSGTVYYEEIVETEKSIKDVHNLVQEWIAVNFTNSNYVTKINTDDQILIKGKAMLGKTKMEIVLNTEFKEGRYRILMDPITIGESGNLLKNEMDFDKEKAIEISRAMYASRGKEKLFEKQLKSGEIEKDIEEFKKMQQMMYDKSKEKINDIAQSLKFYVNKGKSDW